MPLPILALMTDRRIKRFWSRVDRAGPDDCWPWKGTIHHADGYGRFLKWQAHRVAKTLELGRDIEEPHIRHFKCRAPACCNPSHLLPGTAAENVEDQRLDGTYNPRGGLGRKGELHPQSRHSDAQRAEARSLRASGVVLWRIAEKFGCHVTTIAQWCAAVEKGRDPRWQEALEMRKRGVRYRKIAIHFGVSVSTVGHWMERGI